MTARVSKDIPGTEGVAKYDAKRDYLKQDPCLSGQNWAVVSFINPSDRVVEKQLYFVNNFMVDDINKSLTAQATHMARKLAVDMRSKIGDKLDQLKMSVDPESKFLGQQMEACFKDMCVDEDAYVEECRRKYALEQRELSDKYKMYIVDNRTRLDKEYDDAHDQETSVRGFKVRGVFAHIDDAKIRAKYLRDEIEPAIHAYAVPVGCWFPVDMEADEVQDQEYMLPELNELMGKYQEGVHARNSFYQERKREMGEGGPRSTKERLQEKYQAKVNEQRKQELEALKRAVGTDSLEQKERFVKKDKKKKHRKNKSKALSTEGDVPSTAAADTSGAIGVDNTSE